MTSTCTYEAHTSSSHFSAQGGAHLPTHGPTKLKHVLLKAGHKFRAPEAENPTHAPPLLKIDK